MMVLIGVMRLYKKHLASSASRIQNAPNSHFLDGLAIVVILIMTVCAFFIPQYEATYNEAHIFNQYTFVPMLATTTLASIALFVYRLASKKQIPV